ncbi:hypothetical protein YC2023_017594 [Brassica napus]
MDTDKLENFIAECSTKAANIKESCNQKMLVFDEEEENLDADYDESCAGLSIEVLGFKSRIARWLRICNDRYRRAEISLLVSELDHLAAAIEDMRLTIANAPVGDTSTI